MKNINVIIQARMGSSRLPGKVLKKLHNKNSIEHMVDKIKKCKKINDIIIATTTNKEDDELANFCSEKCIKFYRGSENNCLDRFYQTSLISNSHIVILLTSDLI